MARIKFLRIDELADYLDMTPEAIRCRIKRGSIKHHKLFRSIIITPEDIKESFPEEVANMLLEAMDKTSNQE